MARFAPQAAGIATLQRHYLFPLRADRRTADPLPGLLDAGRLLRSGERAVLQVLLVPAPPDWWAAAVAAYERLRQGIMPRRVAVDGAALARGGAYALALALWEVASIVGELLVGEPPPATWRQEEPDLATVLRERPDHRRIAAKLRGPALDVTIRAGVESPDPVHARAVLQALGWALRDLDADNALILRPASPDRLAAALRQRAVPWKVNHDYLSLAEAAALLQLPSRTLAQAFDLALPPGPEQAPPAVLRAGGLRIGTVTFRGRTWPVHLPTVDLDELCLPRLCIGGMGTGKTRGFAANFAYEAVRAGYTVIVFDPAAGEIGDELEAVLPPEQIRRIRLGRDVIAMDWREVRYALRARNRLASEVLGFFEGMADEPGVQTARFLRAAAKAAPGGRLSEITALFVDPAYRRAQLAQMRPAERAVWESYDALSDARQNQIALPVLNRLDVILGDDYLADCFAAQAGLDLVPVMERPGHVLVLDAPKTDLGAEALDVLGALVASKIHLAMLLRKSRHPVFAVWDEPHQYLRSARTWRAAAVESRKWRVGYVWLIHAWEQLPRDVAAIIRAALPHYHLYPSSPATWQTLAAEIAPWTVEQALQIPRYHALHILRAGGRTLPPVLVAMDPPPSRRHRPPEGQHGGHGADAAKDQGGLPKQRPLRRA
ncbi:ATP-binding protein [Thermaerobacter litoralis]